MKVAKRTASRSTGKTSQRFGILSSAVWIEAAQEVAQRRGEGGLERDLESAQVGTLEDGLQVRRRIGHGPQPGGGQ